MPPETPYFSTSSFRTGELGLAIEFLCDQLFEYDVEIPPGLHRSLPCSQGEAGTDPRRSWNFLLVKGPSFFLNASYRLRSDAPVCFGGRCF